MFKRIIAVISLSVFLPALLHAEPTESETPQWIWSSKKRRPNQQVCFRTTLKIKERLRTAELIVAAEYCRGAVFVNDELVDRIEPYGSPTQLDITRQLAVGDNSLGICCLSVRGPAAVMSRLKLTYADGSVETIFSSPEWRTADASKLDFTTWPSEKLVYKNSVSFGAVSKYHWRLEPDSISIAPVDDYEQWRRASKAEHGTDPATFQIVDGFEVDLIHSATTEEGSWVSLARDPRGRWIIGKEKQGLLRVTISSHGKPPKVETINNTLRECRGLVFKGETLYAMANVDKSLFRLRDTNGDEQFDLVEKLHEFAGDAGHGRNQLTLGPDGNVWAIFGDAVFEPESVDKLPPTLPFPTRVEKTRSGFAVRFNEDASKLEVMARGLRNPYGIDFNQHGDMFTYDADAEYDMGSSWYRPTRATHVVVGGDYGWRRVTRDWPPYFPDRADMPQPTMNIGKGSPTAVSFGDESNFTARYRNALFVLDWAYGRILAVHLTPRGSGYFAAAETFLRGQPLNVTDVEFEKDGAMVFITGGRGTQSAIYRVRYVGPKTEPPIATLQQEAASTHAQKSREQRRRLESLLKSGAEVSVDEIWPHLGSDDPWVRHAARAVLEKTPVEQWRRKAIAEEDFATSLAARIALARREAASPKLPPHILKQFPNAQIRRKLEILALAEKQHQVEPDPSLIAALHRFYPDDSAEVSQRLGRILAEHANDEFVPKTLQIINQAETQRQRFHFTYLLRNVKTGWTSPRRQRYFDYLKQLNDFHGGAGLPTFRKLIREEALAAAPENERAKYQSMLAAKQVGWLAELPPARTKLVQKWKVSDLQKAWEDSKEKADPENGRKLFAVARCILCHRAGAQGGTSGPDLTSVGRRFAASDVLTSIVEPSRVIAEKYAAESFELTDGKIITGRISPGDYRATSLNVAPNMMEPDNTISIVKADIVARSASRVSPMPEGLIDTLNEKEIVDLLAYVLNAASETAPQK